MKVVSLSSGSSGNCYLIQHGQTNVLLDTGLSAQTIEKYLREKGVAITQINAIFLTHDHSDHLKSAGTFSRKYGIPVYATPGTLRVARPKWDKMARLEEVRYAQIGYTMPAPNSKYNLITMRPGDVQSIGGLEISSFPVSHDGAETVCYTFRAEGRQATILTDLGCPTEPIFEPLYHSDLLIVEANYELERLWQNSRYPNFLKHRIDGDKGHLSNKQCAGILQRVIEYSGVNHTIWLAHLSEDNNDPKNACKVVSLCLENAGITNFPLQVARRDKPSLTWQGQEQLFQAQLAFDW
jgi:phosphoribosyl 1,2-cyclic phosphodiesterase